MRVPIIMWLRNSRTFKVLMAYAGLSFFAEICFPTVAWALTSGPAQEEFASFEPVSTSDMVDIYSGDFNYNIPLLSVPGPNGGYPINLAYHSGVGMDQEASWVGLGWNVNVGAINRQLRGLPDDFAGDNVTQKMNIRKNFTIGLDFPSPVKINQQQASSAGEIFGIPFSETETQDIKFILGQSIQVYYNNYKGLGYRYNLQCDRNTKSKPYGVGVGLSFDSQSGIGIEPNFSLQAGYKGYGLNFDLGLSYNSRQGLQGFSFASNLAYSKREAFVVNGKELASAKSESSIGSSSLSFNAVQAVPAVSIPMKNVSVPFELKIDPTYNFPQFVKSGFPLAWSGFVASSKVADNGMVTSQAFGYLNTPDYGNTSALKDFQRDNIPYSKKVPNLSPSSHTYDLFMQSGQGTGGMFRPYHTSVGIISDKTQTSIDQSKRLNLEVGVGTVFRIGAGYTLGSGTQTSGMWHDPANEIDADIRDFNFSSLQEPSSEKTYFQMYGEKTGILVNNVSPNVSSSEEDQLEYWKNDEAVRIKVDKWGGYLNGYFRARREMMYDEASLAFQANNSSSTAGFPIKYKQNRQDNTTRQRRGNLIQTLVDGDAVGSKDLGLTKNIGYTLVGSQLQPVAKENRTDHHLSEISVLQPDGMRYIYGLPAYNNEQVDATVSVDILDVQGQPADFNIPQVDLPYTNDVLEPEHKKNSATSPYPEFLSQTTLPAYVHSWLLTAVVSADYVDLTRDGLSDDDYGYWVKFNYDKKVSDYKWRVPYDHRKGMFSEGNKSDPTDDKASFTKGKKDLYYISSIETKTHIALFELSQREDAISAYDEDQSTLSARDKMFKLDKIKLFTKKDYLLCNRDGDFVTFHVNPNAVPIKTINFEYSYSLCPNVNNNSGNPVMVGSTDINVLKGKLTLEKLFFTYQNSDRGKHSPYTFNYGFFGKVDQPSEENPHYDNRNIDRWGNYKANSKNYPGISTNKYPYVDFPYTEQEDYYLPPGGNPDYLVSKAPNVAVWSLKKIELPSGGTIEIESESDDYAYVEGKKAERMFDIIGLGTKCRTIPAVIPACSSAAPLTNADSKRNLGVGDNVKLAYTQATVPGSGQDNNYRVYFRLESQDISATQNNGIIHEKYLDGGKLDTIYFKVYADLKNRDNLDPATHEIGTTYDYVSGYAAVNTNPSNYGVEQSSGSGNYDIGFITLEAVPLSKVNITGIKINPITKAAIEHLRANRPELAHLMQIPNATFVGDQIVNLVGATIGSIADITKAIIGFNLFAYNFGFGQKIQLNGRSIIRLGDPDGKKFGGGVRVKRLTINDRWTKASSAPDESVYGQVYDYTMNENGRIISSGVAYEPRIGNEESALIGARAYKNSTLLSSSQSLYVETPVMQSYYPGPSVGYGKVTVRSIAPERALTESIGGPANNLNHSAAPISIYEFYTAKDFPVLFDETDLNPHPSMNRFILIPGIYSAFRKKKGRSQGYSIVLNDMAGKLKSLTQMTITGTVISKQEYVYHTLNTYDPDKTNRLSSKVQVLTDEGNYQTAIIGQSHDIFIDMNENRQRTDYLGIDANLGIGALPVPIPFYIVPLPYIADNETSLRTVVTNKIIYRTGILKEVITTTDESVIKTENIAYDLQTGEPLLTKVTNEFKDPVFNMSFPAHWFYANMGGAYKNAGVKFETLSVGGAGDVSFATELPANKHVTDYFTEGDEVYVQYNSACSSCTSKVYTVAQVTYVPPLGGDFINLIDDAGAYAPTGNVDYLQVVRSGYRNLQALKAGNLVAKHSDVDAFDLNDPATYKAGSTPIVINETDKIIDASAIQFSDIGQMKCIGCAGSEILFLGAVVNPWREGLRGIWRPRKSWAFVTSRSQTGNIREDGIFDAFSLFNWRDPATSSSEWVAANTITKYSPFGFELENRDAIGRYSAALYEYDNSLVTVVGSNVRMQELAFDAFEDYADVCCKQSCDDDHWGFISSFTQEVDEVEVCLPPVVSTQAHSGKFSIQVTEERPLTVTRFLTDPSLDCNGDGQIFPPPPPPPCDPPNPPCDEEVRLANYQQYAVQDCDCIGEFSTIPGKKYVISAWVKEIPAGQTEPVNTLVDYTAPILKVEFNVNSVVSSVQFQADGKIIEGWQRIFGTFTAPTGWTNGDFVNVTLINNPLTSSEVYFDDIRIHPNDGNMVSYVYDPVTLKLAAELDANNYATFYIYDDEGQLTKVKKETIEGIKTIREGRINNVVKQ